MYGKLPSEILSTVGFIGCLSSIELNDEAADPINNALVPSESVVSDCQGTITRKSLHKNNPSVNKNENALKLCNCFHINITLTQSLIEMHNFSDYVIFSSPINLLFALHQSI